MMVLAGDGESKTVDIWRSDAKTSQRLHFYGLWGLGAVSFGMLGGLQLT